MTNSYNKYEKEENDIEMIQRRTKIYLEENIPNAKCFPNDIDLRSLLSFSKCDYSRGKVRDCYKFKDKQIILLLSTDRQSAFDRHLATIPCKGQVLTLTSAWWFEQTKHIVPNHIISVPDPCVMVCKECTIFPVEFVVRGYITGSTQTSMWTHYEKGCRMYCGNELQDGWKQHQKLPKNMVTPTTKDIEHDELISGEDIVSSGRMSQEEWTYCSMKALELFEYGQQVASKRGLILADTKYEFGKDKHGNILLVDEIHTPDSSRFWIHSTYDEKMERNVSPDHIDKEFLRQWFKQRCDPYHDDILPSPPTELIHEVSRRYITLYEILLSKSFPFVSKNIDPIQRIQSNLQHLT